MLLRTQQEAENARPIKRQRWVCNGFCWRREEFIDTCIQSSQHYYYQEDKDVIVRRLCNQRSAENTTSCFSANSCDSCEPSEQNSNEGNVEKYIQVDVKAAFAGKRTLRWNGAHEGGVLQSGWRFEGYLKRLHCKHFAASVTTEWGVNHVLFKDNTCLATSKHALDHFWQAHGDLIHLRSIPSSSSGQ